MAKKPIVATKNKEVITKMKRKYKKGDILQSQKGDTWKVLSTSTSPVTGKPTLQVGKVYKGQITSRISGVDETHFRKKR